MSTLPVYPRVSCIQTESPGLLYGSQNLPDMKESAYIFTLTVAHFGIFFIFDTFLWLNLQNSIFYDALGESRRGKTGNLTDFDFVRLASLKLTE